MTLPQRVGTKCKVWPTHKTTPYIQFGKDFNPVCQYGAQSNRILLSLILEYSFFSFFFFLIHTHEKGLLNQCLLRWIHKRFHTFQEPLEQNAIVGVMGQWVPLEYGVWISGGSLGKIFAKDLLKSKGRKFILNYNCCWSNIRLSWWRRALLGSSKAHHFFFSFFLYLFLQLTLLLTSILYITSWPNIHKIKWKL